MGPLINSNSNTSIMSTDYQTYSQSYPLNNGFPLPQMVPMGSCSPMFQPLPVSGPVHPMYLPAAPQTPCAGFQGMGMTTAPAAPSAMLPLLPGCSSLDSLALSDQMSSLTMVMDKMSLPATPASLPLPTYASFPSNDFGIPMSSVGSLETYPQSPSPPSGYGCPSPNGFLMMPSHSPQPYPLLPPMISLIPTAPQPMPEMHVRTNSVTITNPPAADPVLPAMNTSDPNLLGYRGNSVPRSRSPTRSVSRGRSLSDCSVSSDTERDYERAEPSKRDLVNRAFAKLEAMFGKNFDKNGNRGENILRLKVKTRTALEKIVPFIEFCQRENLIVSVSCPISTKKGRQQVRGFLAYLQMRSAQDADRVEELIQEYNASNGSPFNTWHRNPPSTWKNRA